MTAAELYDRIHCWLWLYQHSPRSLSFKDMVLRHGDSIFYNWRQELLTDAASLYLPPELENLKISENLHLAITLARSGDAGLLRHIADFLTNVNAEIIQQPLDNKVIRLN